ncbi:NAD-dependent epimerase/dehydratase family protein [Streptomyces sp. MST-110588]|uniref:NAD-dependent epimerase/dehydratase family protein n=1 Tax=Streptomyces sp. MST-110588 TaxID=2833628 RepID=UPI001F5D944D|nr:NAD-dependent epimerase/dehydratase family protein [Streptomyces sp. MST-110588]UNO40586.1 NAD-dependent epimerase/dehydratase family protein [Streptomyces sp. MST-110588]
MRLLVLGGTEFVGGAIVREALARDWRVTVFHRGRHEPPPGVAALRGDRTDPATLAVLKDGEWDAVVDTWKEAPSAVRDTARLLADRAGRYVYVSSRSVYAYPAAAGLAEDGPLVDGASPDADRTEYALDKRGGELAALAHFGDRALLGRAGLILGPGENIGRLPWWLGRIARGGPVPAPGPHDLALQYIDVRDLARWTLDAVERGLGGAYNLVSEQGHATMGELLEACVRVTGSGAELRWTAPEKILAAGVEPWTELPVWLPPDSELYDTLFGGDVTKALETGLRCRPVGQTVADTWTWLRGLGERAPLRPGRPEVGLSAEQEAALLEA